MQITIVAQRRTRGNQLSRSGVIRSGGDCGGGQLWLLQKFYQQFVELPRLIRRQGTEELFLDLCEHLAPFRVRFSPGCGQDGEPRSAIARIGRATDEAIRFQSIDQLCDIRFDASEAFGQLPEGKRFSGARKMVKRSQFGQRKPDIGQLRFDATFEHARGVEHGEKARSFGVNHLVQICSISQ